MLDLVIALKQRRPMPEAVNGEFFWIDDLADDTDMPTTRPTPKPAAREEIRRPLPAGDVRAGRAGAEEM